MSANFSISFHNQNGNPVALPFAGGLLVAVPSLFAYNWLTQRIRHSTMEMESFADEFSSILSRQIDHHLSVEKVS